MTQSRYARQEMPPEQHGTRYGYIYYRCRCDPCKAANTNYATFARLDRMRRLRRDPTLATHGTRSTYINWGCRCGPCTEAHSAACKAYAEQRKGK